MTDRDLVIRALKMLPVDCSMEDITEKVEFMAAIKQGILEAERGEGIPIEEARALIKQWVSEASATNATK